MNLLKRQSEDLQELRDISDDVEESLFCPYACHVSPDTILTKNGELLQTLKIVGFSYEDISKESENLRDVIRASLHEALNTTDYALWVHTIRRKASLRPQGQYPENISKQLNESWNQLNDWQNRYVNEVYVTLVKEGETAEMKQVPLFLRSLLPAWERKGRWDYIDKARQELTETVDAVLHHLSSFGARKLGFYEQDGVIYSEPLSFLNKLTSLRDEPMPVPDIGLDDYLTSQELTFGFNAMEVRDPDGRRRFGSILTVKEYRELPTESIDLLLQTQAEFIITQSMDFINAKKALGEYKVQAEIFDLSGEEELPELTGLNAILASDVKTSVDFGEQQINVFVLGDSVRAMEENVQKVVRSLNGIGIISMREDIKFEEAYWSQLPANFEFLRRLRSIASSRVGGFANISNYPAGLSRGSIWGPPVTVFHTAAMTPYFFNFHIENNGHSMIVGPVGAGKTVLLNFLLSESQKFQPKIYFFDRHQGAEIFLRAVGSEYYYVERRQLPHMPPQERPEFHRIPQMNPLQLPDSPANRSFLLIWLDAMLQADQFYRPENSEEAWPYFEKAVEYLYSLPQEQRVIDSLIEAFKEMNPKLATKMYGWYRDGEFARWFDHVEDDVAGRLPNMVGFEMSALEETPKAMPAVVCYLLHCIGQQLDGQPAMIVMDEAWQLLDNDTLRPRLANWLEWLRSRNTLAILATERAEEVITSPLNAELMQHVATQIYMPNPQADIRDYEKIFGLNALETEHIKTMLLQHRQFLLKRGQQSIVAHLNLRSLKAEIALLSAKPETILAMNRLIETHGSEPEKWVSHFLSWVRSQE